MDYLSWRPNNRQLGFLLPEGVPYAKEKGLTWLLRGKPGTGKTLMSLWLACDSFLTPERGGRVAFFDLEQGKDETDLLFDAVCGISPTTDRELLRKRYEYYDVRDRSVETLVGRIQELAVRWKTTPREGSGPDLIIIDSINAVSDGPFTRSGFDTDIRIQVVEKSVWLMLTCEAGLGQDHDLPWLDYIADVALVLEREQGMAYSRRMLEILKCRNAYHVRGPHSFIIRADDKDKRLGLLIFPSLAAKLGDWRRTLEQPAEKDEKDASPSRVSLGLDDFNGMVGDGVADGSSTAYVGSRSCRKTPCALHFALPEVGKDHKRTLIISLGVAEAETVSVATNYEDLITLLDSSQPRKFNKELVEFRYIWPGYINPSKLVADIEMLIDEQSIRKAIVMDLSQIQERFPLLHTEPVFLSALVQLFRVKGVTSLFVDTVPRTSAAEGVLESRIATLVDNVMEFRHLFFYGQDHIGVTVRRRHGASGRAVRHGESVVVLRAEEAGEGKRKIVADTPLDGFVGLFTDAPRPSPLTLFVFESNEAQQGYNTRIKELLGAAFPALKLGEDLKVNRMSPSNAAFHLRGLQFAISVPQPDVRLAMLDEFWVRLLKDQLSPVPTELNADRERYLPDVACYPNAWPHYLNVGVLAGVGNLARADEESLAFENWQQLTEKAVDIWDEHKSDEGTSSLFDFDKRSPESWSCMLLEVLASSGLFRGEGQVEIQLSSQAALDQIVAFQKVFWVGRTNREEELLRLREAAAAAPTKFADPVLAKDSHPLLLRCWYSDLASYVNCLTDSQGATRLCYVPGGQGIRGEWYWGVIASSRSDIVGWRVVKLLSGEEISARKYDFGVGMPAEKRYYEPGSQYASLDPGRSLHWVKENIWDKAASRARIEDYPMVSPILRRFLYEVLCLDPSDIEMRHKIENLAKAFDGRIQNVKSSPDASPAAR